MKNAISTLIALIAVCLGLTAEAQRMAPAPIVDAEPVRVTNPARRVNLANMEFKGNLLTVMDTMIRVYGETDFSDLVSYIENGNANGSPNNVVPFFAMGHAYLNRYVANSREASALVKALDFFETPAREGLYRNWGMRWASSPTAANLLMGIARLRSVQVSDLALSARIEALDLRGEQIAEAEADLRCNSDYPYRPYVSGLTDGDTKAEENAWEAYLLAWAANMYPSHPRASIWEAKARELAFHSIVRRSEGVTLNGETFSTIDDDFTLTNHWIRGNPYYEGGTVQLIRMGALAYHVSGNMVPAEFEHNVSGLYGNYKSLCGKDSAGRFIWLQNADPVGDPTLFPLAGLGDDAFERDLMRQKSADGWLWLPTVPVLGKLVVDPEKGLNPGSSLGTAIQNGKSLWYVLAGSYLWHFPPTH